MGHIAKTRLLVEVLEGKRELFSVSEQKDGGLQIFRKGKGINYEDPLRGDVVILDEKISVHPSREGSGTTIKRTINLEDGRPLKSAAFVEYSLTDLLFPIYACYAMKLEEERHAPIMKNKDRAVVLTKFNQLSSAIIYMLFVSTLDRTPPPFPEGAGNVHHIEFGFYRLSIYFAFMAVGALKASDNAYLASSPQQEVARPVRPLGRGVLSCTDTEAQGLIDEVNDNLRRRYLTRVKAIPGVTDEMIEVVDQHCRMIFRRPFKEYLDAAAPKPVILETSPIEPLANGVTVTIDGERVGRLYVRDDAPQRYARS